MPSFKSVQDIEAECEDRIEKMREQLRDLADHVRHKHRPSKANTADALLAIANDSEWRMGRWP